MSQIIRDRAWFTAHIRMKTEARLRRQSLLLNVLIVWFSTALTCLTVYQLTAQKTAERDVVSAVLAILVLALSIFIPSLGLDKLADRYRECYLKIQRLLDCSLEHDDFVKSYYDILDAYPNHPTRDRNDFVVVSKINGQKLYTSEKQIVPTLMMWISYFVRRVGGIVLFGAAALLPGLIYFIL